MVKGQGYQESLEQRVADFICEHHLVSGQRRLVVAVSGGQDSVCLLHILVKLREKLGIELHIAHLNHRLRGDEADADAQFVAQLSHQLGIPATVESRDVKAYQAQNRISLEEAAREVRYAFLAEVARSIGADYVAVGHTIDDHIETILMHLIRGTGSRGLRGLQPSSRWQSSESSLTIIRPLLSVSRLDTASYCDDNQLPYRIDASNLSPALLRNRIRHELLPLLHSYNPGVAEALLRTARIADDEFAFLVEEGLRLWNRIAQRQGDTIIFDKEGFLPLPPAMRRHLLRMAIESLLGNLKDIETRHIEEIMTALAKPAGKSINLPEGLVFAIDYNQYRLGVEPAAPCPFPVLRNEFILKIPSETVLPGWRVEAAIVNKSGEGESERTLNLSETISRFTAYFDFDKTGNQVTVRCRRRGDRFQPLGMSQPKSLGEFMIDAKVPRAWRPCVPVVCSPQNILWVVGWRIDDRAKVTGNTERILCLEFERV